MSTCTSPFWTEHLDFLTLLARNSMLYLVLRRYKEYLAEAAEEMDSAFANTLT